MLVGEVRIDPAMFAQEAQVSVEVATAFLDMMRATIEVSEQLSAVAETSDQAVSAYQRMLILMSYYLPAEADALAAATKQTLDRLTPGCDQRSKLVEGLA